MWHRKLDIACLEFRGAEHFLGCNGGSHGNMERKTSKDLVDQQVSGVISIGLMQFDTIPSRRDNQVIGCWLFLGICKDWNMLPFTLIQSIPNMLSGGLLGSM